MYDEHPEDYLQRTRPGVSEDPVPDREYGDQGITMEELYGEPPANVDKVSHQEAVRRGEVVERDGYHQPGRMGHHYPGCGCRLTTGKGAHRDETVNMPDGRTVHFYHQSPVVVTDGRNYRLDSCGWHTRTTKDRINSYLPKGYHVRQIDYDWYLETPDGERVDFEDGMVIP